MDYCEKILLMVFYSLFIFLIVYFVIIIYNIYYIKRIIGVGVYCILCLRY